MPRTGSLVALVLFGTGCAYQATPVPVTGDIALLEGEWEGGYASQETGRTGSILFRLAAGTDSAFGDVVMVPARSDPVRIPTVPERMPDAGPKAARVLAISFVRCEDGNVTGRLEPYDDPETGERVLTTFEGRLLRKHFEGTFSSFYETSGRRISGTWSVQRVNP